eukprot:349804-Chlamydomonas_euryale.AAC.2
MLIVSLRGRAIRHKAFAGRDAKCGRARASTVAFAAELSARIYMNAEILGTLPLSMGICVHNKLEARVSRSPHKRMSLQVSRCACVGGKSHRAGAVMRSIQPALQPHKIILGETQAIG